MSRHSQSSRGSRGSSLVTDSPPDYTIAVQDPSRGRTIEEQGYEYDHSSPEARKASRPPSYHTVFGHTKLATTIQHQRMRNDDDDDVTNNDNVEDDGDHDNNEQSTSLPATPRRTGANFEKHYVCGNPYCDRFWKRAFNCVIVYFGGIGYLILLLVLAIPMMCVGGLYIQECPAEPLIPVYLVVNGALLFFAIILVCCYGFCEDRWDKNNGERLRSHESWKSGEHGTSTYMLPSIIFIICFIWYILGNVWIYSASPPDQDPNSSKYCQKTLYFFAFWTHNVINVLWVLWLCFMSCFGVVMCRENRKMRRLKLRVRQRSRQERLVSAELSGVTTTSE